MRFKILNLLCSTLIGITLSYGQGWPDQMVVSPDGKRLIVGGQEPNTFYAIDSIRTIELWFDDPDYWDALEDNYEDKVDIPATMIWNNDTLEAPVGVRFKGQTSFMMNMTDKKSFNITIDYEDSTQDIHGYNTLNLNCGYEDPSFMRESVYENTIQKYIPGLAVNYVHLFLNGEDWGIYLNVEQLNKDYYKEWFMTNDGSSWRAEKESFGPPGPGGDPFGAGSCSLNYLGDDSTDYTDFYQLKFTEKENPWEDLIHTADVLNNTPDATLVDTLNDVLDVDRTLWYLALEIMFSDDDSYVNKGGMDYYVYWEAETDRIIPMEYDGNSCMSAMHYNWSPFYKATDVDFALLNVMLNNDVLRQRYLAHVRTILSETFNEDYLHTYIDDMDARISSLYNADPKKIYSFVQYNAEVDELKDFVSDRYDYYFDNTEVNRTGCSIVNTTMVSDGGEWMSPTAWLPVTVTTEISDGVTAQEVHLYYGSDVVGRFYMTMMFDDGAHNDGAASDGIWGADIPGMSAGTDMRFYIEAVSTDAFHTVSYDPAGAEHDVFYYQVAGNVAIQDYTQQQLLVAPVPATNIMTIQTTQSENGELRIFDATGNLLMFLHDYQTGSQIGISDLPQGCYILQLATTKGIFSGQCIKM